ncbi:MAG: DUF2075 domain-containing protein [Clostridiales bacterium]|nr:MAG: DUF2075 domain-containing protein [Clostridiales bacterium]
MRNSRCYYSADLFQFLHENPQTILGIICENDSFSETTLLQKNTWSEEINILQKEFARFDEGRIIFEYTIPRICKRVDVVFLHKNVVYLLEFKCGETEYKKGANEQVLDYALDLQNFQKESHDKTIIPIVVATEAKTIENSFIVKGNIAEPLFCNRGNIGEIIALIDEKICCNSFNYEQWENSEYLPTPTIIEAAQALYNGHKVEEITRSDADAKNLSETTRAIDEIIAYSKNNKRKSICFVTGVPGAGKTLVGLNLAIEHANARQGEHAVFLSGNQPLVSVLQEALARDKVKQASEEGEKISKREALRETSAFIQIIHKYRDSFVGNDDVPPERIAIFDEAQRAWTKEMISKFMKTKKGVLDFDYSEPEFLISTLDRHNDWAVVICLVGGGQEINTGEAGLPEWFDSLRKSFSEWDVFVSPQLNDTEYTRGRKWAEMIEDLNINQDVNLHLASSIRSFRTPDVSAFVKAILDNDLQTAQLLYQKIKNKYPILLTRDLEEAKTWVKDQCRGTTRYGLVASSGALRLKPEGIYVKNDIDVENWFLNDKDDVRSSYYLEDVVTEFQIQGLELDYTIVAWDADFRYINGWTYNKFSGTKWQNINSDDNKNYLKNAYRVLLTRARQGMAIFIPNGDDSDETRLRKFYNGTYNYLKNIMYN